METRIWTRDGASLRAQIEGPRGAPGLLLLPGQANSHSWWKGLREQFHGAYQTITFDYRGTGRTRSPQDDQPWTKRGWSTSLFAADAADVLDSLGLETIRVYGTSMGGRVAQVLAVAFGARVSRLMLACSSPGGPQAVDRAGALRSALGVASEELRTRVLLDLFYTPAWGGQPEDSTLLGDPAMTVAARRAHLAVSDEHNAWNILHKIMAPTLILHGTDDRMVPPVNAKLIASRVRESSIHWCHGGRHGFFDEFRGALTPTLMGFLH